MQKLPYFKRVHQLTPTRLGIDNVTPTKENIKKSLVLASLFPESLSGFGALSATIKYVSGRGFSMVEFYSPEGHDGEIASLLKENGLDSVFIGVYPLKAAKNSLCAIDETERRSAVATLKGCIDRAAALGSKSVMINSGFKPARDEDIAAACESYIRSVNEGYDYMREKGYALEITLEPGDSFVQSFQLLGPTNLTVDTARKIRETNPGYCLAMDVAHLMEEGEDVIEALTLTLPYCSHIHLCNCLLNDALHPMYGDKHVDFDYPGACCTYEDFEKMYGKIKRLYAGREFIVSLEIMCRSDDNFKWFDNVAAKTAWLFEDIEKESERNMKVAVIYTSTTPELISMLNSHLEAEFAGCKLTVMPYQNPDILAEARDNGCVTAACARKLMDLYERAASDGAEIILNACSSVGDVAKLAKPLYEMTGLSFVRIDEDMAWAAVKAGKRIGVVATLPTTLEPTKRLLRDCAAESGVEVELVDALAEGAFGLNQEQFKQRLIETGEKVKDKVDILLFAQGSMAYAEQAVSEALGLPVFSSIRFGAKAVRAAADARGVVSDC